MVKKRLNRANSWSNFLLLSPETCLNAIIIKLGGPDDRLIQDSKYQDIIMTNWGFVIMVNRPECLGKHVKKGPMGEL